MSEFIYQELLPANLFGLRIFGKIKPPKVEIQLSGAKFDLDVSTKYFTVRKDLLLYNQSLYFDSRTRQNV